MTQSLSRAAGALTFLAGALVLLQDPALASQGPGVAQGHAGATTQLAMMLIVYGGSALCLAVGLIGAVRRTDQPRRQ